MERTFTMVKPDGVQRGLTGEILKRLENKGFKIVAIKTMIINEELAKEHYIEHADKPFYGELVEYICSGPVLAMVWEGENVISAVRTIMGKTNPLEAVPGTIRGDFGVSMSKNLIHGSDSKESAQREIALFFKDADLLEYDRTIEKWI